MTRVWDEDKMVPVTILAIPTQVVLRHKTIEKDGYTAIVL
jgi:ribosomal protein L3